MDNGDSDILCSIVHVGEENNDAMDRSFTFPSLISGLLTGVLINLSKTYGLLGFATFK